MLGSDIYVIREKLDNLNKQTTSYMNEIKELVTEIKSNKTIKALSYFTYSLNLAHDDDQENLILGSYHVLNLGDNPINNSYICIKLSKDSPFNFSGKYLNDISKQKRMPPNAWERLNDQADEEEYWLKPVDKPIIEPNEMISFSNFQIKWLPKESYKGTIMGFTYGDEIKDGVPAFNQINVSGKVPERGDEGE